GGEAPRGAFDGYLRFAERAARLRDLDANAVLEGLSLRLQARSARVERLAGRRSRADVVGRPRKLHAHLPGGVELVLGWENALIGIGVDDVAKGVETRQVACAGGLGLIAQRARRFVQSLQLEPVGPGFVVHRFGAGRWIGGRLHSVDGFTDLVARA